MSEYAPYRPDYERDPLTAPLVIREPRPDDLVACATLVAARSGGDVGARRKRMAANLLDPDRHAVLAAVGPEIVGFGHVMPFAAPPGAAADIAPDGYYLVGLVVAPDWRRRGIGERLTTARMDWVARRGHVVWSFANGANRPTIDLHRRLGFVEFSRRFSFPGVTFEGGTGVLLCAPLGTVS